ncbi:MAG TPA: hypothetical protein VJT75_14135, partial [Thermoleophilaceae bacterium]|nr:hypothetical protein [Thermoleophilaceae bacterium]
MRERLPAEREPDRLLDERALDRLLPEAREPERLLDARLVPPRLDVVRDAALFVARLVRVPALLAERL